MAGIFQSFIGGVNAGQEQQFNQNRLATLNEQNSPDNVARRNKLADIKVQAAQSGLDQNKAKEGYARLSQAMNSPNPKAYVLQYEPDLAAQLQKSSGVDLSSMDDNQAKGVLGALASHLAGAAGIAAPKQFQTIGDTANPGAGILQKDPQTGELKQVVAPQRPEVGAPDIQGYNLAKSQGFKGSFLDYQRQSTDARRAPPQQQTPSGYRYKPDGTLEFIPGGPADKNNPTAGLGGRESVMFQRVINSANSASESLKNIAELPVGASSGVMGVGASPGHSVLASVKGALTNKLASQDVQDYNTMVAGVSRNLSTIETAGLAPNGSLTASMDSIQLREGDTELTKLRKLAEMRQIIEKGIESNLSNPKLPQEQKDLVQGIIDKVKTSIPFTQSDITKLRARQAKNPDATLQDLIKEKGLDQPAAPSPPPAQDQGGEVRVNSPQEAMSLPAGTVFITPDGRRKVR